MAISTSMQCSAQVVVKTAIDVIASIVVVPFLSIVVPSKEQRRFSSSVNATASAASFIDTAIDNAPIERHSPASTARVDASSCSSFANGNC